MEFKATEKQIIEMAVNAINASHAIGMGAMRATNKTFQPEDITLTSFGFSCDYVQGRMVKLNIKRINEDTWEPAGLTRNPNMEYQSWCKEYATFEDLKKSVGL